MHCVMDKKWSNSSAITPLCSQSKRGYIKIGKKLKCLCSNKKF